MLKTLYAKLAFGLIALLVAIGLLYSFISAVVTRSYLEELNQQLNRDLAANLVSDRNLVEQGRLNQAALKETFGLYMTINPSIEIYLLDLEGAILAYSADPAKIKRKRVSLGPVRSFLDMEAPYPLLGDDPRSHDRQKAFSVTPVPSAEAPEGYLYVVLRGEQYDAAERMVRESHFLRMSGWSMAASLGVGLIAGLIVFRLLTQRLQRLSARMDAFEVGEAHPDFSTPTPIDDTADEVDRLAATFEHMAARIRRQIDQLREQDGLRRRLVAQVSHDLRTPMTAIQGYLESLQMKEATLTTNERAEFLRIALGQTRRLSRLIEELFELASLEARERRPDVEPFAVAELIHDVVAKHRLDAEHKNLSLAVADAPGLPFALGDVGMTERVLDNLLDNAITHTPDGGTVHVEPAVVDGFLSVAVKNSGPGIDEAQLPHLFEPFFRVDGGGSDRGHAGLGLAIAKRIVELQGGDIRMDGGIGKETVFRFRLPLAEAA